MLRISRRMEFRLIVALVLVLLVLLVNRWISTVFVGTPSILVFVFCFAALLASRCLSDVAYVQLKRKVSGRLRRRQP